MLQLMITESSAREARPTMCTLLAGEENRCNTPLLCSEKLQGLQGEVISHRAPITWSKSGTQKDAEDSFSVQWDFRVTLGITTTPKRKPVNQAVSGIAVLYTDRMNEENN